MNGAEGFDLDRALTELNRSAVLGQVCQIVAGVRRTNADRQEVSLGDDVMSLAGLNYRNIANLLFRHFDGSKDAKPIRPRGSFQIIARGYTINVYGLPSSDPQSIVWKYSGTKLELASSNSAMAGDGAFETPTFDDLLFEDGVAGEPGLKANHLVVVHWADADATTVRLWAGFPRDNSRGGSPWLEVVELHGYGPGPDGGLQVDNDAPEDSGPSGFSAGVLPEVTIEWMPTDEPDFGSDAAEGA
jgi:hypothetical protein